MCNKNCSWYHFNHFSHKAFVFILENEQPIGTLYPIISVLWLDDFGVWPQNSYLKVFWHNARSLFNMFKHILRSMHEIHAALFLKYNFVVPCVCDISYLISESKIDFYSIISLKHKKLFLIMKKTTLLAKCNAASNTLRIYSIYLLNQLL